MENKESIKDLQFVIMKVPEAGFSAYLSCKVLNSEGKFCNVQTNIHVDHKTEESKKEQDILLPFLKTFIEEILKVKEDERKN